MSYIQDVITALNEESADVKNKLRDYIDEEDYAYWRAYRDGLERAIDIVIAGDR